MLNVIGAAGSVESNAETIPGPSTDVVASVARGHGVNIVFGLLEKQGTFLYNTAVLIDRSGTIKGIYRKVQLPLSEASVGITPGGSIPVFDTDFGDLLLGAVARSCAAGRGDAARAHLGWQDGAGPGARSGTRDLPGRIGI